MPTRQSNIPICNMKVAELRRLAISHGIPIRNEDNKLKLKCELITELVGITSLPEFQYDKVAPPRPTSKKQGKSQMPIPIQQQDDEEDIVIPIKKIIRRKRAPKTEFISLEEALPQEPEQKQYPQITRNRIEFVPNPKTKKSVSFKETPEIRMIDEKSIVADKVDTLLIKLRKYVVMYKQVIDEFEDYKDAEDDDSDEYALYKGFTTALNKIQKRIKKIDGRMKSLGIKIPVTIIKDVDEDDKTIRYFQVNNDASGIEYIIAKGKYVDNYDEFVQYMEDVVHETIYSILREIKDLLDSIQT